MRCRMLPAAAGRNPRRHDDAHGEAPYGCIDINMPSFSFASAALRESNAIQRG
jgi:hypothetical protein